MSKLNICMLGRLNVRIDGQTVDGGDSRKAQELFSYLLLYRDRPHLREALASLLWGNNATKQAKQYLRKALWQLQQALLTDGCSDNGRFLIVEPEWIQFNPEANIWLDAKEFELAFASTQDISGRVLNSHQAKSLKQAVELYQGDLLEGFYEEWCLFERERFQRMYLLMLDKLMSYCEVQGKYAAGLMYGLRILKCDQARERTHRRLIRLHYLAGNRTEAIRQYEQCASILLQELGVRPAQRTIDLYEQIRRDQPLIFARLTGGQNKAVSLNTHSHPDEGTLHQVQYALTEIQHRLEQDLDMVKTTLEALESGSVPAKAFSEL